MRRTKAEIMEGVEYKEAKVIGNNTIEYIRPDGVKVIRLHRADIITFPKMGGVILNSDGWKTVTTKDRMNSYQSECTIIQDKGLWYVTTSSNPYQDRSLRISFFDGIKIKDGTVINPKKSAHRKEQSLLRQINVYCEKLRKLPELPIPSSGDCWDCSFKTTDGIPMGDLGSSDHLISHLKEKYIHGSLIVNALKHVGYQDPVFIFQMGDRASIIRAVNRYFKSKLGLVC